MTGQNRQLRNQLSESYAQLNVLTKILADLPSKELYPIPSLFNRTNPFINPGGAVYSAAVSPSISNAAFGSLSGKVTICSLSSLTEISSINAHSNSCRDLSWNSESLITVGFDKFVRFWDVEKKRSTFELNTDALVHSVCSSSANAFVAASKNVFWIDSRKPSPIQISTQSTTTAISVYDNLIVYGGYDGNLHLIDKRNLKPLQKLDFKGSLISSLSKSTPLGKMLIVFSNSNSIVFDLKTNSTFEINHNPARFGCRGDILDSGVFHSGDFSVVCGGKMATYYEDSRYIELTSLSGRDYGATFIQGIVFNVITYSEDGIIGLWKPSF